MKAAVVTETSRPPRWTDFPDPVAGAMETTITVAAAALSQLVRAQASGKHYSSTRADAFVPGVDGVGRLADGSRVYFAFPRSPFGAMAQQVAVHTDCCVAVPDDVDDVTAAAIANPGMSSWAALADRAKFVAGESVLINGATGAAGRLAVQIAKHMGAETVIVTGRAPQQLAMLPALGADVVIPLTLGDDDLVETLRAAIDDHRVSVILDYLWGVSASRLLAAIAKITRGDAAPRIRYVQIGSIGGADISLSASVLRSSGLELLGSGLRSVSNARLVAIVGDVMHAIGPAKLHVATTSRPLSAVESAWSEDTGTQRLVFTVTS